MWVNVHCEANSTVSSVVKRMVGESSGSMMYHQARVAEKVDRLDAKQRLQAEIDHAVVRMQYPPPQHRHDDRRDNDGGEDDGAIERRQSAAYVVGKNSDDDGQDDRKRDHAQRIEDGIAHGGAKFWQRQYLLEVAPADIGARRSGQQIPLVKSKLHHLD
jgi:hypothetical protein